MFDVNLNAFLLSYSKADVATSEQFLLICLSSSESFANSITMRII